MKTSAKLLLVVVLALPLNLLASDLNTKPKDCNYSVATKNGARSKSYTCNDFDLAFPNTFTNVCVFKGGSWQYGHLKYDKAAKKHKFASVKVCDQGISVTPAQITLDIRSPSIGDYVRGNTDRVTYKKPAYTSLMTEAPVGENESAVICYRGESRGVSVNAFACSREPNDSNFCEFTSIPSKKYKGKWWIQYRLTEKRKPVVCVGGVKVAKLDEAARDYGEEQVKMEIKTQSATEFNNTLPKPSLGDVPVIDIQVASCSVPELLVSKRHTCKNESSVEFDIWVDDQAKTRDNLYDEVLQEVQSANGKLKSLKTILAELEKKVRSTKDEAKKEEAISSLVNLQDEIEQKVEIKMIAIAAKFSNKYPIEKTTIVEGQCGVEWNPANNSVVGPYVVTKLKGKLHKTSCSKVEAFKKSVISAGL